MIDFITLSDEDVAGYYRAASDEIQRRENLERIPAQISELAQQGREMGIGETTLAEALINAPAEAEAEA